MRTVSALIMLIFYDELQRMLASVILIRLKVPELNDHSDKLTQRLSLYVYGHF